MSGAETQLDSAEVLRKPVLGTYDLMAVLQFGENGVRELVRSGRLRRLAYSPKYILVDRREVLRFLAEQTKLSGREASS